jgi:hypothetical protein
MPKNDFLGKGLTLTRAEERIAAGIQTMREGNIFSRDAFGAYPSTLCQLSLPTKPQLGKSEFTAKYALEGGHFGFSIFTPVEYGIPFGAYPRAIFSYVYRTLMKQKNREDGDPRTIHMGANLRACMNRITGIDHSKITGGPRGSQTLFERQLNSFVRSHMRFFYPGDNNRQERAFALFSRLRETDTQATLFGVVPGAPRWDTHVRASEDLYLDAIDHAMPVDDDVLRALWPSSLRIDQYTWLNYRANELKGRPLVLSWRALTAQFGSGYAHSSRREFRAQFRDGIKAVQRVFDVDDPQCIGFREEGEKVTLTVKHPSVPWGAQDPRRRFFAPPSLPAAAPSPDSPPDSSDAPAFSLTSEG